MEELQAKSGFSKSAWENAKAGNCEESAGVLAVWPALGLDPELVEVDFFWRWRLDMINQCNVEADYG